ncbi:MarR family winged helix-turn-helix transcriptional regulator [Dactylosporangium sp. CA-233914]|uniref:MarR family winged helix-turn-helix transcriptional regulator n=1 Tax=Dactylosporangium sp. CA-233914 TaxID=3239934 RepID=UPI003D93EACD
MPTDSQPPGDEETRIYDLVDRVLALSVATFGAIGDVLRRLDLTEALANVLWQIDPRGHPPTMKEIAEMLYCDPSTVTFLVAKLEHAGLAARETGPRDRRSKVVVLTPQGVETRACLVREIVERSPLGGLTPREQQRLLQLIGKALPRNADAEQIPSCMNP